MSEQFKGEITRSELRQEHEVSLVHELVGSEVIEEIDAQLKALEDRKVKAQVRSER